MAICDLCEREMTAADSCTVDVLHCDGEPYRLAPYEPEPMDLDPGERCGDCGVLLGGLHHVGCDMQRCPRCQRQLISCGCRWDEYPPDEDGDGDDAIEAAVRAFRSSSPTAGPRPLPLLPLAAAAAPLRARHHDALRSLAAWCLSEGRACDLDVAALCLESLDGYREPEGYRLDRPTVNWVLWGDVRNQATITGTSLPRQWHVHLWSVLRWLHDDGRLHDASDPVGPLLEPLRCYGGLGDDGYPMPPGATVDFPCQCYVAHDPDCPPGLALHIVGRDRETGQDFVVRAHIRTPSDDIPLSCFQPLFALARYMRALDSVWQIHPDEFTYVGKIDAQRGAPELWLYRYDVAEGRGFDDLALDEDGRPWRPARDRRRRAGFRWVRASESEGVLRAGLACRIDAGERRPGARL